jgi:hypothetical protein
MLHLRSHQSSRKHLQTVLEKKKKFKIKRGGEKHEARD